MDLELLSRRILIELQVPRLSQKLAGPAAIPLGNKLHHRRQLLCATFNAAYINYQGQMVLQRFPKAQAVMLPDLFQDRLWLIRSREIRGAPNKFLQRMDHPRLYSIAWYNVELVVVASTGPAASLHQDGFTGCRAPDLLSQCSTRHDHAIVTNLNNDIKFSCQPELPIQDELSAIIDIE